MITLFSKFGRLGTMLALLVGIILSATSLDTITTKAAVSTYPARTTYYSNKLCNTFGFGNHADRQGGPMTDTAKKIQFYHDMCTHHIRNSVPKPDSAEATEVHKLGDEGFTLFFQLKKHQDTEAEIKAAVATLCDYVPHLIGVSPSNEIDAEGPDWVTKYLRMQKILHAEVRADPCLDKVKVLTGATRSGTDVSQIGDISKWADVANAHGYSQGWSPEAALNLYYGRYTAVVGDKPRWMTEIGYAANDSCKNGRAVWPEKVSATYSVRAMFASLQSGYQKTYWYKLVDEDTPDSPDWLSPNQQCFGLLRSDWTPKRQYAAMKNVMTITKQNQTGFKLQKLRLGITMLKGKNMKTMVFQKAPNKWLVVNWQAGKIYDTTARQELDPADGQVRFRLPWSADVRVFVPEKGTSAVSKYSSIKSLRYKSNEHLRIFEIKRR